MDTASVAAAGYKLISHIITLPNDSYSHIMTLANLR